MIPYLIIKKEQAELALKLPIGTYKVNKKLNKILSEKMKQLKKESYSD